MLVDAGWFLDIPSFSKTGWFTFQRAARSLKRNWNATYDRLSDAVDGSQTTASQCRIWSSDTINPGLNPVEREQLTSLCAGRKDRDTKTGCDIRTLALSCWHPVQKL